MAKIHGVAGEWARVRGTVIGLWPLFLGVFATGASVTLLWTNLLAGWILLALSLCSVLLSLMFGLRRVESFFKGARGEEKIAGILATLPDSYHVFNDFVVGRSHIDHVVIGPGGVFAVETKCWRGTVTVEEGHILLDGQLPDRPPLAQAKREAALVKKALQAAGWAGGVMPVLVFASNTFSAHRANVQGAVVMNANELQRSFDTERVVIPTVELARLVSLMENRA